MRIKFDPAVCVGHGRCYVLDPEHFAPDDLGHCEVISAEVSEESAERTRRAVQACPEGALTLED
ncbi:MAG: ferredoxin [Microthrixaceae bacterium]